MKIPADKIVIAESKLTNYLLAWRARNDKSKYLAQAGFTSENPISLDAAIRGHVEAFEAILDRVDEYGQHFRIEGVLLGTNSRTLDVVTIWNQRPTEDLFRFVTLKPRR